MNLTAFSARAGYAGAVGAVVGFAIALVTQFAPRAVTPDQTSYPFAPMTFAILEAVLVLVHIAIFLLVLGLARSGLVGNGRFAKVSLAIALVGLGVHVFAEAGYAFAAGTEVDQPLPIALSAAFGVSTILVAIGMVLVGIATLRAGVWRGWGRYTPLAFGIMTVILVPLSFSNDTRNWALAAWCLTIGVLAVALVAASKRSPE